MYYQVEMTLVSDLLDLLGPKMLLLLASCFRLLWFDGLIA